MTDPRTDRDAEPKAAGLHAGPVQYPENHVLGILDTPEQVRAARTALTAAGFRESEIEVSRGPGAADNLHASTGRTGLAGLAIRLAQSVGLADDEMEVKDRYEQALRDGGTVVVVLAPTDERKVAAAQVLAEQGGHFINFLGRRTIENIYR